MKTYDLKPTYENLYQTFLEDTIKRNQDVFRFVTALDVLEDGCSIALDGNWGSGKTFFVKQVKMVLDAANEFIETAGDYGNIDIEKINEIRKKYYGKCNSELQNQVCVYYDAWEHDNDEEPVFSLVYEITKSVGCKLKKHNASSIKAVAHAGAGLLEHFTGVKAEKVLEAFEGTNILECIKEKKDIESQVHDFLELLLAERGNRLVIFIDELDRCKPSYAVRLLERMKHYFSEERITFVFSVNIKQLQHTIKKHYGEEFDASRYLERFFDLRMTLPPPDLRNFYKKLNFKDYHYTDDSVCGAVIKKYRFELREITRFLHITKIAIHAYTRERAMYEGFAEDNALRFCIIYVVPIMIGLQICDLKRYVDFIEGRDCTPLLEIKEILRMNGVFNYLIENNETFNKSITNSKFVSVDDRLKEVYEAIFCKVYNNASYNCMVGKMEFTKESKEDLLRTVGLFSPYTSFKI